jgi:hypothetical protein
MDFTEHFKSLQTEESKEYCKQKEDVTKPIISGKQELSYGIVKKYDNGTTLWFEPITDETDGFVLRKSGSTIQSVFSEKRDTYIMDRNDPNVIAVYGKDQKAGKKH